MDACRPVARHVIAGNVFIKMMTFSRAGDSNRFHKHAYDHLTLLSAGAVEVRGDGLVGRFQAPHLFLTPKGRVHKFVALTDQTVLSCLHGVRDPDGDDAIVPPEVELSAATAMIGRRNALLMADSSAWDYDEEQDLSSMQGSTHIGWSTSDVRQAVCANTAVDLVFFAAAGQAEAAPACNYERLGYLSAGRLTITEGGVTTYFAAPHIFQIPAGRRLELCAAAPDTVLAFVQTLRHGDTRADEIPQEITLDYASARLSRVLAAINEQTREFESTAGGL